MEHEVKSSTERVDQARRTVYVVTGAPVRPVYRNSATRWRPELVTVTWYRDREDSRPWTPWRVKVSANGPKVLKSGADSSTLRHSDPWSNSSSEWDELVEACKPEEDA